MAGGNPQLTEHFGKYDNPNLISYGGVAVLKNGPGPVVYVRTDMDALPIIEVAQDRVPATIKDSALTNRVGAALQRALGKENVLPGEPVMASEDFSLFALEDPKPLICMFWLGAADPAKLKDAMEKGTRLPGPHSSEFAPVPGPPFEPASKP